MKTVSQKKILILGGTKHMIDVVKTIKRMGMSPIVVDDIIGAPAKEFADKSYNINTADLDKLAEISKSEKVSGVSATIEDMTSWNAIALCKKAELPYYIAQKQRFSVVDKEKFMEKCMRFNVSVIEQAEIIALNRELAFSFWQFPMVLKSEKTDTAI